MTCEIYYKVCQMNTKICKWATLYHINCSYSKFSRFEKKCKHIYSLKILGFQKYPIHTQKDYNYLWVFIFI